LLKTAVILATRTAIEAIPTLEITPLICWNSSLFIGLLLPELLVNCVEEISLLKDKLVSKQIVMMFLIEFMIVTSALAIRLTLKMSRITRKSSLAQFSFPSVAMLCSKYRSFHLT
jgi:hypothetical protein